MEDNTPRWVFDLDNLLCKHSVWSEDLKLEVVDMDAIFPLLREFIEPLTKKPTSKLTKKELRS
ncbi:MAG: hypothetical protein QG623_728 [Patescibacteria group bacterium]|nr:hypothetical protein [Patescibacteria group bacterium]